MATASLKLETLGRYRLIEQIGRGGMASVFKALDSTSGHEVAIKVLSPVLAQEQQFTKRFERESEVVMRLSHPNIVPVIDYGQDSGYAYLVMPLLQVGSLADRLAEGPLTPAEGGRLLSQLSQALQFAHDRGVVHRDVKPSNVLLDENGSALLADFGLARIHDASVSLTGSALLGTPAYMSPEQARGEKVGPASDQYSLGVVLYQLCTGNLPFEAETPMAVMLKHINEPVPLAREKAPNVPEAIEHVILKATAKLPEQRFGSVTELNAAFQAALAHARDPFANPAPRIELPPSSVATPASGVAGDRTWQLQPNVPKRSRLSRLAGAAALLLLLALACPVAILAYNGEFNDGPRAAEGSSLLSEDMSEPQLTALAGTIAALSTELAAASDGTQSPEQIQTAVMGTLQAGGDPFAEASDTPGAFVIGDGTPSATPSPGPSPTPSTTPTITQTPSPGPSPTASTTPPPSNTPTATATTTLGPSPTPTSTPTKTATPTSTSSPTPTSTEPSAATLQPTATDDPCMDIWSSGFFSDGRELRGDIVNDTTSKIEISRIYLKWPDSNGNLVAVLLDDGNVIWDVGALPPEVEITSNWKGNRTISSGGVRSLIFAFGLTAESSGYRLEMSFKVIDFSVTCSFDGEW